MIPPLPMMGPWTKGFWSKAPRFLKFYYAMLFASLPFIALSLFFDYQSFAGEFGRSLWIGFLVGMVVVGGSWYGYVAYRCVKLVMGTNPVATMIAGAIPDSAKAALVITMGPAGDGDVLVEVRNFNIKREKVMEVLQIAVEQERKLTD